MKKSITKRVAISWALGIVLCAWPLLGQKVGSLDVESRINLKERSAPQLSAAGFCTIYANLSHALNLSCNGGAFNRVVTTVSGDIPDADLSNNVALLDRSGQEWTGANTFNQQTFMFGLGERLAIGGSGTLAAFQRTYNGSAALYFGVESSTGGSILSGTSAYAGVLGFGSGTNALQFVTNNAVRATIDSSGNVGIGGGSPDRLTVSHGSGYGVVASFRSNLGDSVAVVRTDGDGYVRFGSSSPHSLALRVADVDRLKVYTAGDAELPGGTLTVGGSIKERGRSVAMGDPATRTFSASNFAANSGGGTWTVESGDVTYESWTLTGKTLVYAYKIQTTTISGTVSTIRITIPGGFTAAVDVTRPSGQYHNGTTWTATSVRQVGTDIIIFPTDTLSGTFTTGTNDQWIEGVVTIVVQ
ncbi:MAG TPA: hypothetical protein VNL91_03820 [Thermoanaerobaculia bacterium]|nr:hypothetical protein [Thermoanaerobaculia bacterium]